MVPARERAPVGRDAVEQRLDVGRPDDVHAARVQLRREGHAGQGGVPAVAPQGWWINVNTVLTR